MRAAEREPLAGGDELDEGLRLPEQVSQLPRRGESAPPAAAVDDGDNDGSSGPHRADAASDDDGAADDAQARRLGPLAVYTLPEQEALSAAVASDTV
eukprot:COSAG06_NODE_31952_length_513_cov_1.490338_1_plen_96_part_10